MIDRWVLCPCRVPSLYSSSRVCLSLCSCLFVLRGEGEGDPIATDTASGAPGSLAGFPVTRCSVARVSSFVWMDVRLFATHKKKAQLELARPYLYSLFSSCSSPLSACPRHPIPSWPCLLSRARVRWCAFVLSRSFALSLLLSCCFSLWQAALEASGFEKLTADFCFLFCCRLLFFGEAERPAFWGSPEKERGGEGERTV